MDIKITFPGGKRVDAELLGRGQTIPTDQSVKGGGEGSSPDPFTYFMASIGTCAGIFVLGFCQSRNIPTEGISLVQKNEFVTDDSGHSRLGLVKMEIQVPPDFPEKYHAALIKVADQCKVKQTLANPPRFEIDTVVQ